MPHMADLRYEETPIPYDDFKAFKSDKWLW